MKTTTNTGKVRHQLSKTTSTGVAVFSVTIENGKLSYAIGEFFPSRRGAWVETTTYVDVTTVEQAREEWRKKLSEGYTFESSYEFKAAS